MSEEKKESPSTSKTSKDTNRWTVDPNLKTQPVLEKRWTVDKDLVVDVFKEDKPKKKSGH